MIFRLEYKNRKGVQARLDITTPGGSVIKEIEGTEQPFLLSYKGDKNDKSLNFLTSSAEINIYETPDFNIDILKTSNETQIKVDYYIDGSLYWTGFVIPDFFSREIGGAGVVSMVASDRISTLKGVTLSDLPAMISIRDLAVQCLAKTGLDLPLKTMADFQSGSTVNGFFTSRVASQRLYDTKGRSISCYDILKSILVASNSRLEQQVGEWRITNKLQHELGTGRLYTNENSFMNYVESVFNFNEVTKGAMRSIVPVAGSVGIYHEHGGGLSYPVNYDFSDGLSGWTAVNGFVASTNDKSVDMFKDGGTSTQRTIEPIYKTETTKRYLVNLNYGIDYGFADKPYLRSSNIPIVYPNLNEVSVNIDINATAPHSDAAVGRGQVNFAVIASNGTNTLFLNDSGVFQALKGDPYIHNIQFTGDKVREAVTSSKSIKGLLSVEDGDLSDYYLTVRIYGHSRAFGSGGGGGVTRIASLINSVSVKVSTLSDIPKGNIYKREQGSNFTKAHDIETTILGDYITKGLDGYFYDYPIDDTSSLYSSAGELSTLWTTPFIPAETNSYPLLRHAVTQQARMFSVAHDLISGEIEMERFNPLSIFVDCNGDRYVVVSAEFDFLRSVVKVDLEEIAYANLTVRDFIYSYFGDGEGGIKSVGGIASGLGGGGGSHTHPNKGVLDQFTQLNVDVLSYLSTYQTGVETKPLLDENGDPVLDENGDPVMEDVPIYAIRSSTSFFSDGEVSAYGLGSGGSGGSGGGGSDVQWGTTTNNYSPLIVEGVSKNVALSGHTHAIAQITNLQSSLDAKQGALTAGSNITISGNTISAKDTTYSTGYLSHLNSGENIIRLYSAKTFNEWWDEKASNLSPSAHTHSWNEITGKPSWIGSSKPSYSWNEITGKPSWIGSSKPSYSWEEITNKPDILDDLFEKVEISAGVFAIKAKYDLFGVGEISAYGFGSGGSGGGGGGLIETVYGYSNLGQSFNNANLTDTFNAYTINQINTRLKAVEAGNYAPIHNPTFAGTVTASTFVGALSGNATTATRLATARTIWGQSFNGTANVTGAMTGVTSIAMSAALTGATVLNASQSVNTPKVIFNAAGWSMEQVGSELQLKHNGNIRMKFLSGGAIVATDEITAFA